MELTDQGDCWDDYSENNSIYIIVVPILSILMVRQSISPPDWGGLCILSDKSAAADQHHESCCHFSSNSFLSHSTTATGSGFPFNNWIFASHGYFSFGKLKKHIQDNWQVLKTLLSLITFKNILAPPCNMYNLPFLLLFPLTVYLYQSCYFKRS